MYKTLTLVLVALSFTARAESSTAGGVEPEGALTMPADESALPGEAPLAEACFGDVLCPPRFADCYPWYDFDCGDFFCRTPGVQCGGQLSTYIRVEHVSACYDATGNLCVQYKQGRRLDHCGCP